MCQISITIGLSIIMYYIAPLLYLSNSILRAVCKEYLVYGSLIGYQIGYIGSSACVRAHVRAGVQACVRAGGRVCATALTVSVLY